MPSRVRRLGLVLAALAALLLIFGGMSRAWWTGEEGGVRFAVGLRGVEMCRAERCSAGALSSLGGPADTWEHIGIAAFAACVAAALFLLLTVGAALIEHQSVCPTERVRRGARSARREEGVGWAPAPDEQRRDATQIGEVATEGKPIGALGRSQRFTARVGAAVSFFAAGVATAFVFLSPELEGLRPSYAMSAYYLGAALGAGSAGTLLAAR